MLSYVAKRMPFGLPGIFILGFLVRLVIVRLISWDWPLHYEAFDIAKNIVAGYGYSWDWYGTIPLQPTAAFAPLYPYFIAFIMALFEHPARIVYITQAVLNAAAIFPAFYIGNHLAGRKAGLMAAALWAIYPEIAYQPTKIAAEAVMGAPALLAIYLYLKQKTDLNHRLSSIGFLSLGLLLGATVLIKANAMILAIALMAGLLFGSAARTYRLKAAMLLCLGLLLAISPWLIRNMLVLNEPVIRTMYGYNLWRGNHPGATGTARLDTGQHSEAFLSVEYLDYIERNRPDKEAEVDRFYFEEAVKFIKEDPGGFARLTLRRIVYFLTLDPTHPLTRNIFYMGGYIIILILGISGAIILLTRKRFDIVFLLVPLFYLLFYAPVMILPRYRLGLVWVLILTSAVTLDAIYDWLFARAQSLRGKSLS